MRTENPWAGIERASPSRIHARRTSETSRYDFFWARNSDGRYAFVLDTKEDAGDWGPAPEIRGISIRYYREQHQLQLVLEETVDWEVFRDLCLNLVQATEACATIRDAMDALMARLLRWQRLLSRGPRRILNERELRGLLGELIFLKNELIPRLGPHAISAWQGPDRLPQDFVVGRHLFEVKTYLVGDAPRIRISPPEQLWSDGNPLYVIIVPLAKCGRSSPGACTLPGTIDALEEMLTGRPESNTLESRLADFGYVPSVEYEDQIYSPGQWRAVEVRDDFPRLQLPAIPRGVGHVKYSILVEACLPFEAAPDWSAVKREFQ